MEYEFYYQAAETLDEITKEGFFGENAMNLIETRDEKTTPEYLYECFINVFSGNDYGIKNTIGITLRLTDLYCEAFNINAKDTVDNLTSFFKGTNEYPELENISSYMEWMRAHISWKETLDKIQLKGTTSKADKMKLATDLLTAYSKGVELTGKLFTNMIILAKIIRNQEYDLLKISLQTIYDKINMFESVSDEKYHIFTTVIDRQIRNADSHLNSLYSVDKQAYVMKKNVGKGNNKRIETFEIKWSDMVLKIYPRIGWFVQGCICSCILLYLTLEDKVLCRKATDYIVALNSKAN